MVFWFLVLLTVSCSLSFASEDVFKAALIITLAGDHKLTEYFEWGCRTIGSSSSLFDMLVFHESNKKLKDLTCAKNVKFIDLGEKGLSNLIVNEVLNDTKSSDIKKELLLMLNDIILHSPRYLVEIKPMIGSLLSNHLSTYSHWSYSDPDIIWGNLVDWLDPVDMAHFDIITIAKNLDAGRLFLRGQFTLHKNTDNVNTLWKQLDYFEIKSYAKRIGNAYRMLQEKKSSDEIFNVNFVSAEGWYSQTAFNAVVKGAGGATASQSLKIKIIGRAFDDFFREPVLLNNGRLSRCPLTSSLSACIRNVTSSSEQQAVTVGSLPPMQLVDATATADPQSCKMFWLPVETRFCLTTAVYDKDAALKQDKQSGRKLQRVGEAVLENGVWRVNDEMMSRRQTHERAAFFHFRHWDDYIRASISTTWNSGNATSSDVGCMVLYLRSDRALTFEACDSVLKKESTGGHLLLVRVKSITSTGSADGKPEDVSQILSMRRKEIDVGKTGNRKGKKGNKGSGGGGHKKVPNGHKKGPGGGRHRKGAEKERDE